MRSIRRERGGGGGGDLIAAWQLTVCGAAIELMLWNLTDRVSVFRCGISRPGSAPGPTGTTAADMDLDMCITSGGCEKPFPPHSSAAGTRLETEHVLSEERVLWRNRKNLTERLPDLREDTTTYSRERKRFWLTANELWYVIEAVSSIC